MRNCYLILTCMSIFMPHLVMAEWLLLFKNLINRVVNATVISPIAGQSIQGSVVVWGGHNYSPIQTYTPPYVSTEVILAQVLSTKVPTTHATSTLSVLGPYLGIRTIPQDRK